MSNLNWTEVAQSYVFICIYLNAIPLLSPSRIFVLFVIIWGQVMGLLFVFHVQVNIAALNTLKPKQNRRHFADDSFKCTFLNENVSISIKISLKFDPNGPNNNIRALVHIMAWRRPGDKPLSEPMTVSFPTHICVTRHQWVKSHY